MRGHLAGPSNNSLAVEQKIDRSTVGRVLKSERAKPFFAAERKRQRDRERAAQSRLAAAQRMAQAPSPPTRPGRHIQTGLEGVLNRNEQRREATAAARAAGLDGWGMASVLQLDADGKQLGRCSYDPLDISDVKRVSDLTGLPVELLARAAHDRAVLDRLAAGIWPETKTGGICGRWGSCSCRRCACAGRPGWSGWGGWPWTAPSCGRTPRAIRR